MASTAIAPAATQTGLAKTGKDVVDIVAARVSQLVQDGELHMPENYSAANAMKAAYLYLQQAVDKVGKPVLEVCSQSSIANALLDMVVQGLSPAKKQCYFIAYGKQLVCQRSYMGTVAILRRIFGQKTEVVAEVVYKGDTLEYSIAGGRKTITKHTQTLEAVVDADIVAAYAVIEIEGREPFTEIMTLAQIKKAWAQGQTNGNSPAHQKFPGEMAKKSVLGRACKLLINSADDSYLTRHIAAQVARNAEIEIEAEMEDEANATPISLPEQTEEPTLARLEESDVAELEALAGEKGVSWDSIEELFGSPISELEALSADGIKTDVEREILKAAKGKK